MLFKLNPVLPRIPTPASRIRFMTSPYLTSASRTASETLIAFGTIWLALISHNSLFWHARPFTAPGSPSPESTTTIYDLTAMLLLFVQICGPARSWNCPIPLAGSAAAFTLCILTAVTNAALIYSIPCMTALLFLLYSGYSLTQTAPDVQEKERG